MWDFNDKLDHATECYSVERENLRGDGCAGIIEAGEPHHAWHGVAKGIHGLDFDHPDNRPRLCRHCIRANNWRNYKDKSLLVKVELTYSDGSKRWLEDEAALDWERSANTQAVMSFAHGLESKPLPWKEKP